MHNHEILADQAALATGLSLRKYQEQLLTAITPATYPALGSGLSFSLIIKRFIMLQQPSPSPRRRLSIAFTLTVCTASLCLAAASVSFEPAPTTFAATEQPNTVSPIALPLDTLPPQAQKSQLKQQLSAPPPPVEKAPPLPPRLPAGMNLDDAPTEISVEDFRALPHPRSPMNPPQGVPIGMLLGEYIDRWVAEELRRNPGSKPRTIWPEFARRRTVYQQQQAGQNPPPPPPLKQQ